MVKYKNPLQGLIRQTSFQPVNVRIEVCGCVGAAISLPAEVLVVLELHHNQSYQGWIHPQAVADPFIPPWWPPPRSLLRVVNTLQQNSLQHPPHIPPLSNLPLHPKLWSVGRPLRLQPVWFSVIPAVAEPICACSLPPSRAAALMESPQMILSIVLFSFILCFLLPFWDVAAAVVNHETSSCQQCHEN